MTIRLSFDDATGPTYKDSAASRSSSVSPRKRKAFQASPLRRSTRQRVYNEAAKTNTDPGSILDSPSAADQEKKNITLRGRGWNDALILHQYNNFISVDCLSRTGRERCRVALKPGLRMKFLFQGCVTSFWIVVVGIIKGSTRNSDIRVAVIKTKTHDDQPWSCLQTIKATYFPNCLFVTMLKKKNVAEVQRSKQFNDYMNKRHSEPRRSLNDALAALYKDVNQKPPQEMDDVDSGSACNSDSETASDTSTPKKAKKALKNSKRPAGRAAKVGGVGTHAAVEQILAEAEAAKDEAMKQARAEVAAAKAETKALVEKMMKEEEERYMPSYKRVYLVCSITYTNVYE